jgi:uncharacterized membrane protein YqhA
MTTPQTTSPKVLSPIAKLIFFTRWLQLPLYLGLILAQGVYVSLLGGASRSGQRSDG